MEEDSKYEALEEIGHGSFGTIRKVRRKSDGLILCRKEVSYRRMSNKEREQLSAELNILKDLRHQNIVAYYERDHKKDIQGLHIYMEYCGNGDLGRVINDYKARRQPIEEAFVWGVLSQVALALFRCHYGEDPPDAGQYAVGSTPNATPIRAKEGKIMILHRDLKPENVFLADGNVVKLGDFGLSKAMASHDMASTYVGTPYYMSPEICLNELYTLKSDIWSLGCIIYELCALHVPFNAASQFALVKEIRSCNKAPLSTRYSKELRNLIDRCLSLNPAERPTTQELINMPEVKVMRKELAVLDSRRDLREKQRHLEHKMQEVELKNKELQQKLLRLEDDRKVLHHNIDESLRREWEVKASLKIQELNNANKADLERQFHVAVVEHAKTMFEQEFQTRLTQMKEQGLLRDGPNADSGNRQPAAKSFSTVGDVSEFPSQTDATDLSMLSPGPPSDGSDGPFKRSRRTPFTRAKTVNVGANSPMDIQMAEPSPITIGALSLSPRRRNQPGAQEMPVNRGDIFAPGSKPRWEAMNAEDSDSEDEPDTHFDFDDALNSPTLKRGLGNDPFNGNGRQLGGKSGRPSMTRVQTLPAKAPQPRGAQNNIFAQAVAGNAKTKVREAVPVVATSPSRRKSKAPGANEGGSPVSKGNLFAPAPIEKSEGGGLKSKRGNLDMMRAFENRRAQNGGDPLKTKPSFLRNPAQVQGRTLVELQQARGIQNANTRAGSAFSDVENERLRPSSSHSTGSGYASEPAVWDVDNEIDLPSPFIRRVGRIAV